jgi:cytochrome c-type biogenesis protein CcmH
MLLRRELKVLLLSFAFGFTVVAPAHAVQPDEVLDNPALEARARDLSAGLRCLVCQNQSIDDSDAPLAKDLRVLVRERLKAGDSDKEIIDFVVARYGEFVLLKPRFSPHTWLLWLATPIVLLAALAAIIFVYRRRDPAVYAAKPLTVNEKKRLKRLMDHGRGRDGISAG